MGGTLKYEGTRLLIFLFLLAVLYFVGLPNFWGEPTAVLDIPDTASSGEDIPITVTAKAWNENYSVRQISISINTLSSSAVASSGPLVPLNLLDRPAVRSWSVSFRKRLTMPVRRTFDLALPVKKLSRQVDLRAGEITGTVDVDIDYTVVTMKADYPPLSVRQRLPFQVQVR